MMTVITRWSMMWAVAGTNHATCSSLIVVTWRNNAWCIIGINFPSWTDNYTSFAGKIRKWLLKTVLHPTVKTIRKASWCVKVSCTNIKFVLINYVFLLWSTFLLHDIIRFFFINLKLPTPCYLYSLAIFYYTVFAVMLLYPCCLHVDR